jgi:hypothetical protein
VVLYIDEVIIHLLLILRLIDSEYVNIRSHLNVVVVLIVILITTIVLINEMLLQ